MSLERQTLQNKIDQCKQPGYAFDISSATGTASVSHSVLQPAKILMESQQDTLGYNPIVIRGSPIAQRETRLYLSFEPSGGQ